MNAAAEKVALEHEAARIFMRHYEQRFGIKMRHIWHNEPRRPDVSCYYDSQRLDLEIAHLYGSEAEAMHILGRELSQQTHQELLALLRLPVEQRMLESLNRIICNKAQKYYDSQRVWLVIRNANSLGQREYMLAHCDKLHFPKQHPYEQIWVVGDMLGISGILPLFPLALLQTEATLC